MVTLPTPQPDPIKVLINLPYLPDLTYEEAVEAGVVLVGEASERIASRIVEEITNYYLEEEADNGDEDD